MARGHKTLNRWFDVAGPKFLEDAIRNCSSWQDHDCFDETRTSNPHDTNAIDVYGPRISGPIFRTIQVCSNQVFAAGTRVRGHQSQAQIPGCNTPEQDRHTRVSACCNQLERSLAVVATNTALSADESPTLTSCDFMASGSSDSSIRARIRGQSAPHSAPPWQLGALSPAFSAGVRVL